MIVTVDKNGAGGIGAGRRKILSLLIETRVEISRKPSAVKNLAFGSLCGKKMKVEDCGLSVAPHKPAIW